jgi:hypothetical protein
VKPWTGRTLYCRREVTHDPDALAAFTPEKLQQRRMKDVVAYDSPLFTAEVHRWRWNGQKPTAKFCDRYWWIDREKVRLEWEIILTHRQRMGRASHLRRLERERLRRLSDAE